MSVRLLGQRSFTFEDQAWFAAASGDHNPIHVVPEVARRLLAGEVMVHGMHALLWALDEYSGSGGCCPAAVAVVFHAPIAMCQKVMLRSILQDDGRVRLTIVRNTTVLVTILLTLGGRANLASPLSERPPVRSPRHLAADEMKDAHGEHSVSAARMDIDGAFPHAAAMLGPLPTASIMALSYIVGMECPGLHSLFAGLDLSFDTAHSLPRLAWRVARHSPPPAPLRVVVEGGGISGSLSAFVRPAPVDQPSSATVSAAVRAGAYAGQVALVVGGARGLGELTAKIIAAGGGHAVITYHIGDADARRVAAEIELHGGRCSVMQLDVKVPNAALTARAQAFTHLYYFAAPRISQSKAGSFDSSLYAEFSSIFVEAFGALVSTLPAPIRTFYPSSVFIDEMTRDHAEYIVAKHAGEALCAHFGRHVPGLSFVVRRLPRLPTDQTATLIRRFTADPLPLLIDVVREMHRQPGEIEPP